MSIKLTNFFTIIISESSVTYNSKHRPNNYLVKYISFMSVSVSYQGQVFYLSQMPESLSHLRQDIYDCFPFLNAQKYDIYYKNRFGHRITLLTPRDYHELLFQQACYMPTLQIEIMQYT